MKIFITEITLTGSTSNNATSKQIRNVQDEQYKKPVRPTKTKMNNIYEPKKILSRAMIM